ncbi:hypothetical protein GCM10012275_60070 [Longimycelium tulufanense]|uniref:Glycolipid-binding domain-containing protein n=2 Tax=Longimycelium tulufanense TaxID=907463 RepID=A0A8J3CK24_9PSEU|nr:hypothetical protein GCM10012275_60070 [Longimycelium tulufanense]
MQAAATNGRRPVFATWQAAGAPRLESARLVLNGVARLRAFGRAVAAGPPAAYSMSYELTVDESGATQRLVLATSSAAGDRQLSLSRADDFWLVDRGNGAVERIDAAGALDVDVQDSILFNALPIRRLGLHREAAEFELPVVWVSLPELTLGVVRQTYRTVSVSGAGAVVNFRSDAFTADITVDADGIVADYPGVAHRV